MQNAPKFLLVPVSRTWMESNVDGRASVPDGGTVGKVLASSNWIRSTPVHSSKEMLRPPGRGIVKASVIVMVVIVAHNVKATKRLEVKQRFFDII